MRILIDIDGVLADTMPHWIEQINKIGGMERPATEDDLLSYNFTNLYPFCALDRKAIFDLLQKPGFTESIPVVPNANKAVEYLNTWHDVRLVTARQGRQHIFETFGWLENHFPFLNLRKQLVFATDKSLIRGHVLIDDSQETCAAFLGATAGTGSKCIIPEWTYNRQVDLAGVRADPRALFVPMVSKEMLWGQIFGILHTLATREVGGSIPPGRT